MCMGQITTVRGQNNHEARCVATQRPASKAGETWKQHGGGHMVGMEGCVFAQVSTLMSVCDTALQVLSEKRGKDWVDRRSLASEIYLYFTNFQQLACFEDKTAVTTVN